MTAPSTGADALWPLHVAIVAALAADAPLVALLDAAAPGVPAIYSAHAGPDAPGRRIVLALTTGADALTLDERGITVTVQLDVYAPGPGFDLVFPIVGRVCAVLAERRLTLGAPPGGWNVAGYVARTHDPACVPVTTFVEPDGVTMHGVVRYAATVLPELAP